MAYDLRGRVGLSVDRRKEPPDDATAVRDRHDLDGVAPHPPEVVVFGLDVVPSVARAEHSRALLVVELIDQLGIVAGSRTQIGDGREHERERRDDPRDARPLACG
jgi:hypothetical protein